MFCQKCGVEAPTKNVSMHRNIGLLVMRLYEGTSGNLCKPCISGTFWQYTAVNMFLGWWGVISFIITPFFLLINLFYYLSSLGMEAPAPGATAPQLTDEVFERMAPHSEMLFNRLGANEPLDYVAPQIAQQAGVTPGQVALYVHAIVAHHQQQQQQ